jgi:hypothetical protein
MRQQKRRQATVGCWINTFGMQEELEARIVQEEENYMIGRGRGHEE